MDARQPQGIVATRVLPTIAESRTSSTGSLTSFLMMKLPVFARNEDEIHSDAIIRV